MKGSFIVLSLCVLALFVNVESAALSKTEREKKIEETIIQSFADNINFGNFSVDGGRIVKVHQTLTDVIVFGLATSRRTANADLTAGTISLAYEADVIRCDVSYDLDGYLWLMKIWGSGTGSVYMNDVKVTANATVELVNDKIQVNDMKITYVCRDGSFKLSSLYGEKGFFKPLTTIVLAAINADSERIFDDILPPYIAPAAEGLKAAWIATLADL